MKTPVRILLSCMLAAWLVGPNVSAQPLRVAASTPDVASLARQLGGEYVRVFCFTKGPEDPHVVEIFPSLVRELHEAELFMQVGLGIENAWLKDLATRASNERVEPGGPGNLNLGTGVRRLEEGDGPDAVPGSFHEEGNPHYLLDPVEGLKAARLICDRYVKLRPASEEDFEKLHAAFVKAWAELCFGETLAATADLEILEDFENTDALEEEVARLAKRAQSSDGITGLLGSFRGISIVGDHDLWPYFARRHGFEVLGYLEPSPGVPPTTKHLAGLIERMKEAGVRVILTAPYFDQRHGRFVSGHTGAKVVPMAHQTAARPGAADYLDMLEYNAVTLAEALRGAE